MPFPFQKYASFFALASLALVSVSGAARAADVTIVAQTTTKGYPAAFITAGNDPNKSVIVITYFKNNKMRTESGKTVEIYDGTTGTSYTLNPDAKTYFVTKGLLGPFLKSARPSLVDVKLDSKTFVEAGNETRTIAGQKSKNYKFLTVFKVKWPTDAPAVKALPASPNVTGVALDETLPVRLTIEGEEWAAEGLHAGLDNSPSIRREFDSLPYLFPLSGAAFEEFTTKITMVKGFIMDSTTSMTFSFPAWAAAVVGDLLKDPIVTTTETKVISTATLDNALFAPPADYQKIEIPATAPAPVTPPPAT